MSYLAFFALILACLSALLYLPPEDGWRANPEVVSMQEQQRPEFIWREAHVPEYELPDLLKSPDGSLVRTQEEWQHRRGEILQLFRDHMYGHRPENPEQLSFELIEEDTSAMEGTATLRRVKISSTHQNRNHRFEVILFLPNKTLKPVPLFMLINNRDPENTDPTREFKSDFWPAEEAIERGYGIAALQNNELAPDDTERFHEGIIQLFEGEYAAEDRAPDAWAALAAWGWGASRAMDYFETDNRIDAAKVALMGHSRGGKASLWAGAEDERFALVISNQSGSGGAALSRRRFGETIQAVNRFTHWFAGNLHAFNNREEELPIDQHMLIALIAPRAVYVASADEDLWADPRGEFLSLVHASPAYALWDHDPITSGDMPSLNRPFTDGPRGYHIRSGGHNLTGSDWGFYMDFADHLWK